MYVTYNASRSISTLYIGYPCLEEISKRYNLRKGRGGSQSDIYDGAVYQHLFHTGFLANKHIVNTDGIPVFRSSSFSLWPIMLLVNELPYRMRYFGNALIGPHRLASLRH